MESKKLSDLHFDVNFKCDLFIEVHFVEPVLSPHLTKFLEGIGFAIKINGLDLLKDCGLRDQIWKGIT